MSDSATLDSLLTGLEDLKPASKQDSATCTVMEVRDAIKAAIPAGCPWATTAAALGSLFEESYSAARGDRDALINAYAHNIVDIAPERIMASEAIFTYAKLVAIDLANIRMEGHELPALVSILGNISTTYAQVLTNLNSEAGLPPETRTEDVMKFIKHLARLAESFSDADKKQAAG